MGSILGHRIDYNGVGEKLTQVTTAHPPPNPRGGPYASGTSTFLILLEVIVSLNQKYSGTPPYGHLDNTVSFFQPGKMAIHFLTKKKRYAVTC